MHERLCECGESPGISPCYYDYHNPAIMTTMTWVWEQVPGLGLLMTLKGEFGVGLLQLLEEVESTPLAFLCPVSVAGWSTL